MSIVGYARVSSRGQSLAVQLDKLAHCDKIFEEKKSGTSTDREAFNKCMEYVREGDTLVVTRLDRLARSTLDLCRIAEELARKNVCLHVIDQNINTADATGRLLFNMLGAIGQFETEIRAERQRDGIRKAISEGKKFGRKLKLTKNELRALKEDRDNGLSMYRLAEKYGIGRMTVYRYLKPNDEQGV